MDTKLIKVELYVNLSKIYHKKGSVKNQAFDLVG